jgi:succinate-acetate transporter protein
LLKEVSQVPVLAICIVISLAFYVFYKAKHYRSKLPIERKWISAKSSMALGLFVGLFGINQLFLFHTTVTYIVAAIFILMGFLSLWSGWKAYRYFTPLAIEEYEQSQQK